MQELLDYGHATVAISKLLKVMTFKPITSYFKEHYMKCMGFDEHYAIYRQGSMYAFVNRRVQEYAKIPTFAVCTLQGKDTITYIIGPWIFLNGFESTAEGRYLIKIFPYYFNMSPRTDTKVTNILTSYGYWVHIHKEYKEIMSQCIIKKS